MKRIQWALVLVLLLGAVALAADYAQAPSAPANVVTAISSADTSSYDTPIRPRLTKGNGRVLLSPTFSNMDATCCLEIVVYQRTGAVDTYFTIAAVQTFTANAIPKSSSRVPSLDGWMSAPTLGMGVYDVRVQSISAGSVTWKAIVLGDATYVTGASNQ